MPLFGSEEEEKGFWPNTGSKVLNVLEVLERPAQALKVGVKEAADGDEDGFFSGVKQGWMGEDEVRTLDLYDPETVEKHPFLTGVTGFLGDVLTDPLTYTGTGLAKGALKGAAATYKAVPGSDAATKILTEVGDSDFVQGLAQKFNVSWGEAKQIHGRAKQANDMLFGFGNSIDNVVKEYKKWADSRASELGMDRDELDTAFRTWGEKHNFGDNLQSYSTLDDGGLQTRDYMQIRDILGNEGRALAASHRNIYDTLLEQERRLGIRTGEFGQQGKVGDIWQGERGYMPHIATPSARAKYADDYANTKPLQRDGFVEGRTIDASIDEANALYQERYGFNVFHTDPAVMLGVRYSNSAAAQSHAWFREQVKQFGQTAKTVKKPYKWETTRDGRRFKQYVDEGEDYDGVDYYHSKPGLAPKKGRRSTDDWERIVDIDGTERWYPKNIAKQIKEREEFILGTGSSNEFLKWYDQIQNGWKKWTLGVRPSYHTRNAVGNMFNAYTLAGVKNPMLYINAGRLQAKVMRGEELLKEGNFMGTGMSEYRLWEAMNANGVVSKHQYGIDVVRETEERMEELAGFKKTGADRARNLYADNKFVEAGFAAGSTIEQNARIAVFMDKMRRAKGSDKFYDPATGNKIRIADNKGADGKTDVLGGKIAFANQEVKKSLFDYSDLSGFERKVLKRFMPFYTWSRKNIPAQLEALVTNPQRMEHLNIARAQFEYMGGRPDEEDIGPFWKGRVPVFLGKEKDNVRKVVSLLNWAPIADIERVYEALGDPKQILKDMASPLMKVPLEHMFNYDSFREKPIKEYQGQTKDFLGIALPAKVAHAAQILVPLADLNRVNPMGVFGMKTRDPVTGEESSTAAFGGLGALRESGSVDVPGLARFIRFMFGVQEYDVNLATNEYWKQKNFVKDVQRLKTYLKVALAKGQNRRAQELYDLADEFLSGDTRQPIFYGK